MYTIYAKNLMINNIEYILYYDQVYLRMPPTIKGDHDTIS